MTACTASRNAGVIHCCTTFEGGRALMTRFTSRCGSNVRRWFFHNIRIATTMTSRTTSHDAIMVHWRWYEGRCALMAGFTSARGREVCR